MVVFFEQRICAYRRRDDSHSESVAMHTQGKFGNSVFLLRRTTPGSVCGTATGCRMTLFLTYLAISFPVALVLGKFCKRGGR